MKQRHNEVRDCWRDLASEVWPQVIKEPIVQEAHPTITDVGIRLNLGVRGVCQPQTESLFDIDRDAPSYKHCTPEVVLESVAKDKKRLHQKAVEDGQDNFTPFIMPVIGTLHREA